MLLQRRAQPGVDAPGPHMTNYRPGAYAAMINTPDEVVYARSQNQPPVKVA